jgi:threonine aldolase
MKRIRNLANERDLAVHLDGARLANAVVATGISFKEYAACADTISMCFSKGLGAPVGSVVTGGESTIQKARRKRKQFGGGMRQAGILAAAAVYALDHHIERLATDHENARSLGDAIESIDGLDLVYPVETNIVIFRVDEAYDSVDNLMARLETHGVRAIPFGRTWIRMVTHLDVDADGIAYATDVLANLGPAN